MMFRALRLLHSRFAEDLLLAPFDGLVTPAMLDNLRKVIPKVNPYSYCIEQFAAGSFPFEAYTSPEAASDYWIDQD
jgi:hypothetical protein